MYSMSASCDIPPLSQHKTSVIQQKAAYTSKADTAVWTVLFLSAEEWGTKERGREITVNIQITVTYPGF